MGRCDDEPVSFGICGLESNEKSDVPCLDADASSIPLPFSVSNLFIIVGDNAVRDFGVFLSAVCNEQTMFLTIPGFVDRDITGTLEGGGKFIESIDFLCVSSDER